MRRFAILVSSLIVASTARVQAGPDEDFIAIYHQLQEADQAMSNGQTTAARARYGEIQAALKRLQTTYPGWSPRVVEYRLNYVNEKLAALGAPAAPAKPQPATQPAPADPLEELRRQVAALQQERTVLQNKLQEALAAQPAAIDPRELQKAEARIADLQKEKDLLRVALEQEQAKAARAADQSEAQKEIAALKAQLAASAAPAVAMERELAAARKEIETIKAALAARPAAPPVAPPAPANAGADAAHELAVARARLAVLDARKVPYTPEELALFQKPNSATELRPNPAPAPAAAPRRAQRELPPGADIKLAQARRAAVDKNFAEAEQRLQEVLKLDDRNVYILGLLAGVQLEQSRLQDAEATLEKSRAIDPNDPATLTNLGILRFRQGRYDDAFDLLARSAEVDPNNPETQNYLGITLSEKGQRVAAENALRKAVQLAPGYAEAHHNLAVIYATQEPPFLELAKFHYQRARAAGQPANPTLEKQIEGKK